MKLEILVSTMNCTEPKELVKKMNINSDAIIINQCDKFSYEEFVYQKHLIKVYSFNERGLGLSRNNALMRASGDIVLLADDDEIFEDGYEKLILEEFRKSKNSDMIIFDIKSYSNRNVKSINIKRRKRVNKLNCLKYGSVRLAFRLDIIRKKNILFTQVCGAGTKYGSGEDSVFIYDCLNKRMKIFTSPLIIASVDFSESSWFKGYDEKYYFGKGAVFRILHGRLSVLFMIIYLIRHKVEKSTLTNLEKLDFMIKGKHDFEERK